MLGCSHSAYITLNSFLNRPNPVRASNKEESIFAHNVQAYFTLIHPLKISKQYEDWQNLLAVAKKHTEKT